MDGVVPPLPQYAFMAWCSVRGSTGTTLPFTFTYQVKKEELGATISTHEEDEKCIQIFFLEIKKN
jgi:hypothetical protein